MTPPITAQLPSLLCCCCKLSLVAAVALVEIGVGTADGVAMGRTKLGRGVVVVATGAELLVTGAVVVVMNAVVEGSVVVLVSVVVVVVVVVGNVVDTVVVFGLYTAEMHSVLLALQKHCGFASQEVAFGYSPHHVHALLEESQKQLNVAVPSYDWHAAWVPSPDSHRFLGVLHPAVPPLDAAGMTPHNGQGHKVVENCTQRPQVLAAAFHTHRLPERCPLKVPQPCSVVYEAQGYPNELHRLVAMFQ